MDLLDMLSKNTIEINETPRDLESKVAEYTVESVMAEMDALAKNRASDSKPPQLGATYQVQSLNINTLDKTVIDNTISQYNQEVKSIISEVMSKFSSKSDSNPTLTKSSEVSTKDKTSLTIPKSTLDKIEKAKMTTIDKVKSLFSDANTDWSIYLESKMNETPSEVSSYLSTLTPPIEVTENTNSYLESVLSVNDELVSFTSSLKDYSNTFTKIDVVNSIGEKLVDDVAKGINKNISEVTDWVKTPVNALKSNLNERIDNLSNIANTYSLSDIPGLDVLKNYDVDRTKLGLGNYMSAVTTAWYIDIIPYKYDNNVKNIPPDLKSHFFSNTGNFLLPIISFQLSGESINSTSLPIFGGPNINIPSSYARPTSCSVIMPSVYSTSINIGKDIASDLLSTVNIVSGTKYSNQDYKKSGPCLMSWKRDYINYVTCNKRSGNKIMNYKKCTYVITLIRKRFRGDISKRDIESFKYLVVPVNVNIQMSGDSDTATQSFDSIDFQIVGDNYSHDN